MESDSKERFGLHSRGMKREEKDGLYGMGREGGIIIVTTLQHVEYSRAGDASRGEYLIIERSGPAII